MKRIVLLLAVTCLAACSNDTKDIKQVAYDYCMATANYRIDEAEQYCTKETSSTTLVMARYLISLVDTAFIASNTPAEISIEKVERLNDTAAVVTYHNTTPIKSYSNTVDLRKRDGRWLVHLPLEAPEKENTTAAQ